MNDFTTKTQKGDKSKPVRWVILLPQDITQRIEDYALKHTVPEADVFRQALWAYLGKPKAVSQRLRGPKGQIKAKPKESAV